MNPTFYFSQNWNGKLTNTVFTTIRFNSKILAGSDVDIVLNKKYLFTAEVVERLDLPFAKIPKQIVVVDTGYPYDQSLEIFKNFTRSSSVEDLKRLEASLFVLKRVKKNSINNS